MTDCNCKRVEEFEFWAIDCLYNRCEECMITVEDFKQLCPRFQPKDLKKHVMSMEYDSKEMWTGNSSWKVREI